MTADKAIIVLSPLDSPYHADDAVAIPADCGHQAWIGPTAMNTILNPFMRTETQCLRCVPREKLRSMLLGGEQLRSLPGTREEMARAVGQELADKFYDEWDVTEDLP